MVILKKYLQPIATASAITAAFTIAGCSDTDDIVLTPETPQSADSAQLRVIHTSPDAPPVNVKLDTAVVVPDLDYAESSGYLAVDAGSSDIAVEAIIPGGNLDVITVPGFPLDADGRYTVLAVNDTASIEALVANESAAAPASDEVSIAVVHASPDVGSVDVYVTAPGVNVTSVDPTFTFDFKGQVDAGALPVGLYQIQITPTSSKSVAYDSGELDLNAFAGQKLMLVAVSTTNETAQQTSPVKLLAATDTSSLELYDEDTNAGARVVHLSPDAGTAAGGPVEVFATSSALPTSPTELIDAFSYTDVVPGPGTYVSVPEGEYVFDVAPDGAGIGSSVYTSPTLSLDEAAEYTVIAAGYVLTTPEFGLLATEDENRSIVTQASVKVVHAAPLAGLVDVYVTTAGQFTSSDVASGLAGAPLLADFAFADITEYVAVAPGDYDIRVVAGGVVAINVEGFNLAAGSVSTVIAREPIDTGLPDDFNVIVLTN